MNKQIVRLTHVSIALVAVLVLMTTYWQTWAAPALADRQDNSVRRVAEFSIDRGLIVSTSPFRRLALRVAAEVERLAPHLARDVAREQPAPRVG